MSKTKPKLWRLIWYKLGGPEYPKSTPVIEELDDLTLKTNYDHLLADYERLQGYCESLEAKLAKGDPELQKYVENLERELVNHKKYCGLNLTYKNPLTSRIAKSFRIPEHFLQDSGGPM